ncbi:hypothetical protein JCM10212_000948 [Sporobolomyces blumeae]
MDDADEPSFSSPDAALTHYRTLCTSLQTQLAAAEQDISDFTESSKELQHELEQELERMEKAEKGMRRELETVQGDRDEWKTKFTTALRDHTTTMTHMQRELESLRSAEKALRAQLRDMELDNDDLEKSEREKDSSLQDLENRYNKSLERIALLEEELVTKAQLDEEVQRLKDELRDVNEELLVVRSSALPRPDAPSRPLTPPGVATFPTALAVDSNSTPTSSSQAIEDAAAASRRTPSPSSVGTPPSIEFVNPTPAHASTLPISPSIRASLNRPQAPSTPSGVPGSATLARSTRMSQFGSMIPQSPSTTSFARSRSPVKSTTAMATPVAAGTRRADSMIRDMQMMTSRVKQLTQRLDSRRNLVMAGSAIPRASMSPTSAHFSTMPPPSVPNGGGMTRSTTRSALARSVRPTSRLGHHSTTSSEGGGGGALASASTAATPLVTSTRPPSRSSLRSSIHGRRTSIPGPVPVSSFSSIPPVPSRPHSRMSSLSTSSAAGSSSSRPVTPSGGRSPTPTGGAALRNSSRPPWNSSLGKSVNGTGSTSGVERRRVASSSYGGVRSASLSRTIGPGDHHARAASTTELGRTVRRPPSRASDREGAASVGAASVGAATESKARRASGAGLGLGRCESSRHKSNDGQSSVAIDGTHPR